MFICKYCNSEKKTKNSLVQHEIRCKHNENRLIVNPSRGMLGKKGSNQYTKAIELGLPKPSVTAEQRKKHSEFAKKQNKTMWTKEQREKHSASMRKAVEMYPESYTKRNVVGRVKNVEYNGYTLKGSWELKTAKWLDAQNLSWQTENYFCEYMWHGKLHKYYPDFYVAEYDLYIEVKGYKTERDEAKWSQFNKKLVIIDSRVIHKLENKSIKDLIDEYIYGPVV